MRILYLLPYVPYPLNRGTYQRTYHLCRELARSHEVDLFCLDSDGEDHSADKKVFESFCRRVHFHPFQHKAWPCFLKKLLNPVPATVTRWYDRKAMQALKAFAAGENYDLIHFCDLVLWPYVQGLHSPATKVIDRSRVDLLFQQEEMTKLDLSLKQRLSRQEGLWKLKRYERMVAATVDATVVCGDDDAHFIHQHISPQATVHIIPNGVDASYFSHDAFPQKLAPDPTLFFCGTLDYSPNIQALQWYFEEIDPYIRDAIPHRRVCIAGLNPTDTVRELVKHSGVELHPNVPDVRPYYQRAWAHIVPLKIGGGTRLKIVESLSIGCPVISTTIGAQGLHHLESGRDLIRVDDKEAFARAVIHVLQDPGYREQLKEHGIQSVLGNYTWGQLGKDLSQRYLGMLEHKI
ncbi:MAG: glycosyltransferase [Chlamydiia bacterium]|nr:glycosyltransferase [Chlamydiia bacterium]